jgi:hypothetical protein
MQAHLPRHYKTLAKYYISNDEYNEQHYTRYEMKSRSIVSATGCYGYDSPCRTGLKPATGRIGSIVGLHTLGKARNAETAIEGECGLFRKGAHYILGVPTLFIYNMHFEGR